MDSVQHLATFSLMVMDCDQPPQHFPIEIAPKKIMVTVCWFGAGVIHYSLSSPGETIAEEKYSNKSAKYTVNSNTNARFGQQKRTNPSPRQRPASRCVTTAAKVERVRLRKFASFAILTRPLAYRISLLQAP
ncbi:unnamed protein product [Angiostrongylus costaricensis]|uniref:Uncharacterized protein n=1 Tax=Angiostrongylus costaricensis TaxID=334426 RepID=A0A0R3PYA5_ANGCS|nr:unnamed protein product [Angiostrongylus costaricensis]